ncbi:MAG: DNA polymerase III subunit beta [Thermodesulfovibrionales bacterium]|nr:DNA polymerase III subunit beta [Thermodesulfovibrionales bacterium]
MHVQIKREELLKRLSDIQYLVDKKGSLVIINHFLLNAQEKNSFIMATDLETAIKEPINLDILQEGRYCLIGKLIDIVRELEGDTISIEFIEEGWMKIRSDKSNYRLACMNASDFPAWPTIDPKERFSLPNEIILDMINKTLYAAGEADSRYALNCLLFHIKPDGTINMVGTDGHRLALSTRRIDFKPQNEMKILLSKRSLSEIKRVVAGEGSLEMLLDKNYLLLKTGEIELLCRVIEGNFPNYENVIPVNNDKIMVVKKESIVKVLKRASIISKEKTSLVRFDIDDKKVLVSANNPDFGEYRDELEIEYVGDAISIGFSSRFLLDALNVIDTEKVKITMKESLTATLITSDKDDYDYKSIVMPMRL